MICITGRIGSGKSTVARFLSEILGWKVIDVDRVGHEILETDAVKEEIKRLFGDDVIIDGRVDRSRLRNLVFKSGDDLEKLEKILHPIMADSVRDRVGEMKNAVVDCALLVRMKLLDICDLVITVISDYESSRSRKPGLSDEEFRRIWNSQEDVRPIGILLENRGDLETLRENVRRLVEYLELSPHRRIPR